MSKTAERIQALLEREYEGPVVSLYLKLGPHERSTGSYKVTLKTLAKKALEGLEERGFSRKETEEAERLIEKVKAFVDNPDNLEGCGGIAVFAAKDLFEVFKLPYAYMDRLVVDRTPLVRGLVAMVKELGAAVYAAVDGRRARIFRVEDEEVQEVADITAPETWEKGRPGVIGKPGALPHTYAPEFSRLIKNEKHRHFKRVADELFEIYKSEPFHWLVVAGPGEDPSEFVNHLHPFLIESLLGTVKADLKSLKPHKILRDLSELLEAKKAQWEEELIREFRRKAEEGLVSVGLKATLRALYMGQVRTLIVKRGYWVPGFRCPDGSLSVEPCEGGVQVPDVVDDAIEQALGLGSEVFITSNEELLSLSGEVGAILRFKV